MSSNRTKAGRRASRRNYCINLAADAMHRERVRRHHVASMREARRSMMQTLFVGGFMVVGAAILRAARLGLLGARR